MYLGGSHNTNFNRYAYDFAKHYKTAAENILVDLGRSNLSKMIRIYNVEDLA